MSAKVENQDNQVQKEITLGGITYIVKGTVDISITPKGVDPTPQPNPDPNIPKPDSFGTIKDGAKWSKNPGKSETWKVVNMSNDTKKFKIVDTQGLNIIADLESEAQAKALIDYFKVNVFPPKEDGGTVDPQEPDKPDPEPVPSGDLPYKISDKFIKCSQRGPTTRHYASGAPDDNTIEKNGKSIPFGNQLAVFEITVPKEMEHDDNLSIKIGGDHMSNGWFDNGISIYEGQTCLGTEVKHPSTKKCIVKGKKYGDIRGKRVQVAASFFYDSNKTEYWVNIPDVTKGWEKAAEGSNIGGFKSKAKGNWEVQLRIDGFKNKDQPPEIHSAAIYEIIS